VLLKASFFFSFNAMLSKIDEVAGGLYEGSVEQLSL
jgi:hypothetical protein